MKLKIYQIDTNKDEHGVMFMSMDYVRRKTGTDVPDSKIYEKVYEGKVDCKDLEKVYEMFNTDHPEGYKGHSLSVSDIVEVTDSDTVKEGFYYCDDVGFKEVDFTPIAEKEAQNDAKNKLKVLFVEPNKVARFIEIEDDLKVMQDIVGGYIAEYLPFDDDVALVCNDEGKLDGLPLNRQYILKHLLKKSVTLNSKTECVNVKKKEENTL